VAGEGRRRADLALIGALLEGLTDVQAAERAGVSERTVYRRRNDPGFMAQLNQARAAAFQSITDRSAHIMPAVFAKLARYLVDDALDPHLGMTPNGFHARRLQATGQLIHLHFEARAAARDEEVRLLHEQVDLLEREVGVLRELIFPGEEGAGGRREPASAD
jgi:hypothetical protein